MAYEITNAEAQKFEAVVSHVAQQVESKVRDKVTIKRFEFAKELFMTYLGDIEPVLVADLLGPTVVNTINHKRRQVTTAPYSVTLRLDIFEDLNVVTDFASPYAEAERRGMNRKIDKLIIAAARATAYETQTDGITKVAVALPSGQKIAHGDVNLTVDKLIRVNELFIENEIPDDLMKFMPLGPKQVTAMLREVEYISRDYNGELAPLKSGKMATFLGITFIPFSSGFTYATGGIRYLPIWVPTGIGLGLSMDIETFADRLPESNQARQFQKLMKLGATRLEEKCVVEVACKE